MMRNRCLGYLQCNKDVACARARQRKCSMEVFAQAERCNLLIDAGEAVPARIVSPVGAETSSLCAGGAAPLQSGGGGLLTQVCS